MNKSLSGWMIGCAGGVLLWGCASEPAPPPAWAGGASEDGGPGAGVSLESLMPELSGALPSESIFTEERDGRTVRLVTERGGDGGFTVSEFVEGEKPPLSVSEMRLSEQGLSLTRITNRDRNTITDFRPPMLIAPARAEPGAVHRQELELIVHPIEHPERISNRGKATYVLSYEGPQSVDLAGAGGRTEAWAFVERMEASFPGAGVESVTRKWYGRGGAGGAPGQGGLVARQSQETVSVLGIPGERKTREIRLRGRSD